MVLLLTVLAWFFRSRISKPKWTCPWQPLLDWCCPGKYWRTCIVLENCFATKCCSIITCSKMKRTHSSVLWYSKWFSFITTYFYQPCLLHQLTFWKTMKWQFFFPRWLSMAERNTTTVYHAARTLIQDGGHIPPVTSPRAACKRSINKWIIGVWQII